MKVMRYIDLYRTVEENGQRYEIVTKANITLPIILNPFKVSSIGPFFTKEGRTYKNVSIISYETGEKFKVVGNYEELNRNMFKVKTKPMGFNGK